MKRQQGLTLVELMVAMLLVAVLSAALFQSFVSLTNVFLYVGRAPGIQAEATATAAAMGRAIQGAAACQRSVGCRGLDGLTLAQAMPSRLSFYETASGATATYVSGGGQLVRTRGNARTILIPDGATVSFRYALAPAGNPAAGVNLVPSAWRTSVSGSARTRLMAVEITVRISRAGISSTARQVVNLRNALTTPTP